MVFCNRFLDFVPRPKSIHAGDVAPCFRILLDFLDSPKVKIVRRAIAQRSLTSQYEFIQSVCCGRTISNGLIESRGFLGEILEKTKDAFDEE